MIAGPPLSAASSLGVHARVCVCVRGRVKERHKAAEEWRDKGKPFLWETLVCVFQACFDSCAG